jgi:hypothetical protein
MLAVHSDTDQARVRGQGGRQGGPLLDQFDRWAGVMGTTGSEMAQLLGGDWRRLDVVGEGGEVDDSRQGTNQEDTVPAKRSL